MSAPVFVVDPVRWGAAAQGGTVVVDGAEGRHGAASRRLRVGELVDLVDGAGTRASGDVAHVGRDHFEVRISVIAVEPAPQPRVTVVQALPKGDRGPAAVEMLTEAGADAIVPWAAARSVAVWRGDKAERGAARWRATAAAAAKQSRRSLFPHIGELSSTALVAEMLATADLAVVLHESAAARLAHVAQPTSGSIVVVVGPEGGIGAEEMRAFEDAGALPVRLGDTILRTSTAGVAALSVVLAGCGRWD